jgi:hypothetical protein
MFAAFEDPEAGPLTCSYNFLRILCTLFFRATVLGFVFAIVLSQPVRK